MFTARETNRLGVLADGATVSDVARAIRAVGDVLEYASAEVKRIARAGYKVHDLRNRGLPDSSARWPMQTRSATVSARYAAALPDTPGREYDAGRGARRACGLGGGWRRVFEDALPIPQYASQSGGATWPAHECRAAAQAG